MVARGREPLRTCVVCREVRAKSELVRLVTSEGRIVADRTGRMPGRGAYACGEHLAGARARASRALRAPGSVWSVEET